MYIFLGCFSLLSYVCLTNLTQFDHAVTMINLFDIINSLLFYNVCFWWFYIHWTLHVSSERILNWFFLRQQTTEESRSCSEVRDEREAINLFIPPPCQSWSSQSVRLSSIKLSRASFLPQHVLLQETSPRTPAARRPFVRSRLVKPLLGCGGETMWPWVSSLMPGKCKGSRDRLDKTSVRRTVNTEAPAPPLTCSERPGRFGPGLVDRRHCGLQRSDRLGRVICCQLKRQHGSRAPFLLLVRRKIVFLRPGGVTGYSGSIIKP